MKTPVQTLSGYFKLIDNVNYAAAHSGSYEAAIRLVDSLITNWDFCKHWTGYVIPVQKHAGNQIPVALAVRLSQNSRMKLFTGCFLTNSRPGNSMIERMSWSPNFQGVIPCGSFTIVDDVFTTGITLKALKNHIHSSGSIVTRCLTLACSKHGKEFEPSLSQVSELLLKFPDARKLPIWNFTSAQINYILRFNSVDAFFYKLNQCILSLH